MAENHPCSQCEALAFDRAIICPALGVIAYSRCKRIKSAPCDKAFEKLYGMERASSNKRTEIKARRNLMHLDSKIYRIKSVTKDGSCDLAILKRQRGTSGIAGAQAGNLGIGVVAGGLLAAVNVRAPRTAL